MSYIEYEMEEKARKKDKKLAAKTQGK